MTTEEVRAIREGISEHQRFEREVAYYYSDEVIAEEAADRHVAFRLLGLSAFMLVFCLTAGYFFLAS